MSADMGLSQELIQQITEHHDGEGAMTRLLNSYQIPRELSACYSMYNHVVGTIIRDPRYVNPDFKPHCESLIDILPPLQAYRIQNLLSMTPHQQHRVFKSQKPYLTDEECEDLLWQETPMIPALYFFTFPAALVDARKTLQEQQLITRLSTTKTMPKTDTEKFLHQAQQILLERSPISNRKYGKMVAACLLLSGRRVCEVLERCHFAPTRFPFQIQVSGLAKKRHDDTKSIIVPVLVEAEMFIAAIRTIRKHREAPGTALILRIARATKDAFGVPLSNPTLRRLYTELSWNRRHQSQFMPEASRSLFDASALGHAFVPTQTLHYQTMTFDSK